MSESLLTRIQRMAEAADQLAEELRLIPAVPGEAWVGLNGLADDLEALERDLRSDLGAQPPL